MTQRRVEKTRVHFWTFSPVSVKEEVDVGDIFELVACEIFFRKVLKLKSLHEVSSDSVGVN